MHFNVVAKTVYGLSVPMWRNHSNIDHYVTGVESAAFPGQSPEEVDRLLHMVSASIYPTLTGDLRCPFLQVVVGGGPTGVELRYVSQTFLSHGRMSRFAQWRTA